MKAKPRAGASPLATLLLGALLCTAPSSVQSQAPRHGIAADPETRCVVERITDGDTIRCQGKRRVRLLLIDSPERQQTPFGQQAAAQLAKILPKGSSVRLEFDVERHDRYGRTLAYVYAPDGRMANEEMVRAGFATVLVYRPNVKHLERIRSAATTAQALRKGLWATSGFSCLPKDHRRKRC